jgi:septum formation protein
MLGSGTRLILASASPRRAEILRLLGVPFEVIPSGASEEALDEEPPVEYCVRIARAKAAEVAANLSNGFVVGADTIVVVDGRSIGKPDSPEDARAMLRSLSGRWHAVMTGVAVREAGGPREISDHEKTLVRFRELTESEIAAYVETGEPLDKAGAYAIQGRAMLFVDEIAGNYHNVVGLPPTLLARMLKRLGVNL